jgi:histidinol phosphatase-like enzyme
LENLLKEAQGDAHSTEEEKAQLKNTLKEAESEVIYLQEVLGEAKAESMKLKESLIDKESELHSVVTENEELRTREAASLKQIDELSKLLEEASHQKQAEENGEISDSEKDYDMLPKVVEFSEQNGDGREYGLEVDLPSHEEAVKEIHQMEKNNSSDVEVQTDNAKVENANGNPKDSDSKEKEDEDAVEVDLKMWDSYKVGEKDLSPDREQEQQSVDEDIDSKVEGVETDDQENGVSSAENMGNGGSSPSKEEPHQKKKKPLLRKFGSLLKRKSSSKPEN